MLCNPDANLPRVDGRLSDCVWPGGYPLFYVERDTNGHDSIVCPGCARITEEAENSPVVVAWDVNWEDSELYCDACGVRIPSAYAAEEGEED